MKQRLNVAQAIFEKQNIILLDEPTNALDNDGVQLFTVSLKRKNSVVLQLLLPRITKRTWMNSATQF